MVRVHLFCTVITSQETTKVSDLQKQDSVLLLFTLKVLFGRVLSYFYLSKICKEYFHLLLKYLKSCLLLLKYFYSILLTTLLAREEKERFDKIAAEERREARAAQERAEALSLKMDQLEAYERKAKEFRRAEEISFN